MKPMTYRGYAASVKSTEKSPLLVGKVNGVPDIGSFYGNSEEELQRAFEKAIDLYLSDCEKSGVTARRQFSGRFTLRINPDLHEKLSILAAEEGQSVNLLIENSLTSYLANRKV
ncbi:MAG: type II toxin-antitoxin system HicB family antitoxin [Deltaproteobacteria bacterium]|jgi:predicted HicB family RNase H-like nuclease|nr:type II toxin-antitoxin system HicB family antitoxin [Deltaproteobacteria bacterium]